jgi:hypothetical protein
MTRHILPITIIFAGIFSFLQSGIGQQQHPKCIGNALFFPNI